MSGCVILKTSNWSLDSALNSLGLAKMLNTVKHVNVSFIDVDLLNFDNIF